MLVGTALEQRRVVVGERATEPVEEVAAVGQRTALDDAALVDEVEEQSVARLRLARLVHTAERARGPDGDRSARLPRRARAEIRARPVEERRLPLPRRFLTHRR